MKATLVIVCVASVMVSACTNASDGNPSGRAYAGMPGGVIATQPQTEGVVTYDPRVLPKMPEQNEILGMSGDRGILAKPTDAGTSTRAIDQL